jgi:hypothetical protein
MRSVRVFGCALLFVVSCASLNAENLAMKSKRLSVTGTLTDVTVDAGSDGWCIQLNPVIMVYGTQISTLEIKSSKPHRLASLEDKFVEASGKLTFVDDGPRKLPVFELSSIREHKSKEPREERK